MFDPTFPNCFLTTITEAYARPVLLLIYQALYSGTGSVPVRSRRRRRCVPCADFSFPPQTSLDAAQLGHAKVVLDNSVASGSITRNGTFVMCVRVVQMY